MSIAADTHVVQQDWTVEHINRVAAEVAGAPAVTSPAETTLVSLDGRGLLAFRTPVVDHTTLVEELATMTPSTAIPAVPAGAVEVSPTLLAMIESVQGVVSATFDAENAIEVVADDDAKRDDVLIRIDRVLRECAGESADRISVYLS